MALCVAALALARLALRVATTSRERLKSVLPVPLTVALLGALSWAVGDPRFVLATPALINAAMLVVFGSTLRGPESMVERFALLEVPDLSPAERAHCRATTAAWCALFVVNGLASAALAIHGDLRAWAVYTGPVSYGLMGALFTVEFVVRSYRFRRHGDGPLGRLMARVFPPRGALPVE